MKLVIIEVIDRGDRHQSLVFLGHVVIGLYSNYSYICNLNYDYMKFSISFNIPEGVDVSLAEVDKCTADISISGISVAAMRKVLAELSEMSLRDFARLATLSALSHDEDKDKLVESGIVRWCSFGSALPGAVLSSGKHPLSTQPT